MLNLKQMIAGVLGIIFAIIGFVLRIFAYDMTWPKGNFGYSGPREDTIWAIQQAAYQEIGLILFIFGLMVILATIINWLWMQSSFGEDKAK